MSSTSDPLIVLCAPRSYSSVISAMLGQHPDLYACPELNLFLADTVGGLFNLNGDPDNVSDKNSTRYLAGLMRVIADLEFGGQGASELEESRRWIVARRQWSTASMFEWLVSRVAPLILIDKSPRTAMSVKSCARVASSFPRARIIHLTRHPVTTIHSLCATIPEQGAHINRVMATVWIECHTSILKLLESTAHASYRLQSESILCEADEGLKGVFDWLGLPCGNEQLDEMRHPERSKFAFSVPELSDHENAAEFLRNSVLKPFEPCLLSLAELDLDLTLSRRVANLAQRLGYFDYI